MYAGSDGAYRWAWRFGAAGYDTGQAIAFDSQGDVVIAGAVNGAVDFGDGNVVGSNGESSLFLATYERATGHHRWSKGFVGVGIARAITIDSLDNITLTGDILAQVDFGGGPLPGIYAADIFLAQFSTSGSHRWSKRFQGLFADEGMGVAAAGESLFGVGTFTDSVDFGGGPMISPPGELTPSL
jgi:hypothetical protein